VALRKRRLLIIATVLVALVVGAILALPFLVDADSYRETVRAAAEEAMGRPVRLGKIGLSVFPRLALTADDLVLGATENEGGGDLLIARRLEIGAELMPLLQRRLEVTSLVIREPELRLRRREDGSWLLPLPVATTQESTGQAGGEGAGTDFSIGLVALRKGRVMMEAQGQSVAVLEDLDLKLRDVALDRPLNFAAAGTFVREDGQRRRVDLDGTIGWEEAGESLAVYLEPTVMKTGDSRFNLEGRLEAGARDTGLDFKITGVDLASIDLKDILSLAGVSLPGAVPGDAVHGEAMLEWRDGRAVLAPLELEVLGGRFSGEAILKPGADPPRFQVAADLTDIRADELLQAAVGQDILSGRLGGKVELRGSGRTYEEVVRSATGGGRLKIEDGHLNGLDVLASLSEASGVFGEDTVQKLSQQLESDGTDFAVLAGEFIMEKGRLISPDLLLKTEDMKLTGSGTMDLISGNIKGTFLLTLSRAVSDSMKGEGSRAARLFWNDELERVALPLKLSGPAASPEAGIDWAAAASSYLESEIRRNPDADLSGALRQLLGQDDAPAAPSAPPRPADPAPAPAAPDGDPTAQVTRVRWGGPILAPDMKLEGWVAGTRLASASIRVEDAGGRVVDSTDSLYQVEAWRKNAGDSPERAQVEWTWEADGKRFLVADFPVHVIVTVQTIDGRRAEIRHTVQR
jgi:AsmA protein